MIIQKNSPLRRLPQTLDQRQLMFFDAIRYSVEMADVAHMRLVEALHEISFSSDNKDTESLRVPAIMDAWSIIDSSFRLRSLIEALPNLKKKATGVQLFLRETQAVRNLRNVVQHLDNEIQTLIKLKIGAWGSLSWATIIDKDNLKVRTCVLIPGRMFDDKGYDILNPAGLAFESVVDHITLRAGEYLVSLSDVMRSVQKLMIGMEKSLEEQVVNQPTGVNEALLMADIDFSQKASSTK